MIFIDTNIVIWTYQNNIEILSQKAIDLIENNDLYISPLVKLELGYLFEIGKIIDRPQKIIDFLYKSIGLIE